LNAIFILIPSGPDYNYWCPPVFRRFLAITDNSDLHPDFWPGSLRLDLPFWGYPSIFLLYLQKNTLAEAKKR